LIRDGIRIRPVPLPVFRIVFTPFLNAVEGSGTGVVVLALLVFEPTLLTQLMADFLARGPGAVFLPTGGTRLRNKRCTARGTLGLTSSFFCVMNSCPNRVKGR
jgi:hypothetical protein